MNFSRTGKPATATDANNNTTSFTYDPLDRLSSVKDAMGRTTSYGYDALSRQVSISNLAIQSPRCCSRLTRRTDCWRA
jgi:YD repeat-containing protein